MHSLKGVKILIGPSTFAELDGLPLETLLKTGCQVIKNPYGRKLSKEELISLLVDNVGGLIAGLELVDREVLEKTDLKVIARCGSGISNIDLEAVKDFNVKFSYTPDAPTISVAELTIGAMISLLRQIPQMNEDLKAGKWSKKTGFQLNGKTVLIIGFGRIGRKVACLLKPFKVRVITVDPNLGPDINCAKDNIEVYSLEEALPQADIVTIHASGEKQILGEAEFKLVKNGVFLLNAARGKAIDEDALVRALESGKVSGAWVDTFGTEPYKGPLQNYPQVIITPHVGSYTLECRRAMELEAVRNLISAFGEIKENVRERT